MAMIRCDQGHFYDNDKHSICPWCGVPNMDLPTSAVGGGENKTVRLSGNAADPGVIDQGGAATKFAKATDVAGAQIQAPEHGGTARLDGHPRAGAQEGVTIAISKKKLGGLDPVVGWLVCVEGGEKGKDYRIHAEKNTIGRADNMDIVLKDSAISRENHAYIVFNPKNRIFRIQTGDGRGLIYVNGDEVIVSQDLTPQDAIEMGESKFRFVPFCGEQFTWDEGTASGDKG